MEELTIFAEDEGLDLGAIAQGGNPTLRQRYGGVPFSVMNMAQTPWQDRKRHWLNRGIRSELGRSAKAYQINDWAREKLDNPGVPENSDGTSIFDPVLAEMLYRWLCPAGGMILDPFAGGSVRGIVAGSTGFRYHGIELRPEQVDANREQGIELLEDPDAVRWDQGDATDALDRDFVPDDVDLVFTCPPYYDLEVYSDDEADLSAMGTYDEFLAAYEAILTKAVSRMAMDRFAVIVVGDFRDKRTGYMRPFVADTIAAMERSGAHYYQEVILVTPAASLPVRTAKQFDTSRKFGKQHQQALVFVKGDPRTATAAITGGGS